MYISKIKRKMVVSLPLPLRKIIMIIHNTILFQAEQGCQLIIQLPCFSPSAFLKQ
jgi:hypothetical protein